MDLSPGKPMDPAMRREGEIVCCIENLHLSQTVASSGAIVYIYRSRESFSVSMLIPIRGRIAPILLLMCLAAGTLWGQLATSSVVGTVSDPGGLGMPNVAIKAVHVET